MYTNEEMMRKAIMKYFRKHKARWGIGKITVFGKAHYRYRDKHLDLIDW
jgi:hypothetical protein